MDYTFLLHGFDIAKISYKKNENLKSRNTFKINSTASVLVIPESIEQFQSCLGASKAADSDFFILGGGSNLVFPDEGYSGILISTENLINIIMTDNDPPEGLPENTVLVTCEAGTTMSSFVNFCTRHNLSGAEQFAGLPGTVGGATFMNARCFDKSISDIIYEASYIQISDRGKTKILSCQYDPQDWDYKKSPFQTKENEDIKAIASVTFKLIQKKSEEHSEIENNCKHYINERVSKGHFKYPSAGSVFKNNRAFGKPSGQLIDEAGLKGMQIGGAQIAPFHGNFIINIDNATADDIEKLVIKTQDVIKDKYNFLLEPEIIFLKNKINSDN